MNLRHCGRRFNGFALRNINRGSVISTAACIRVQLKRSQLPIYAREEANFVATDHRFLEENNIRVNTDFDLITLVKLS